MTAPDIEQLAVGDTVAGGSYALDRNALVRYAGASGDFNPIHYRDDVAASVGLPGVLAHGMLTMGLAVQPVVDWAGDPARVIDYQVRFTRPVVVDAVNGATVRVSARIGQIDADAGVVRVDLTVTVPQQGDASGGEQGDASGGEQAVLGKAQARVSLS